MSDYYKTPTTAEVWAVMHASHPDMKVYASYSAPEGGVYGSEVGVMETSYTFKGCDFPIIEARTTWDIVRLEDRSKKRENTKHEYWLCVARKEETE